MFALGVFAAQPPGPAPAAKAGQPPGPAPPAKAAPPPAGPAEKKPYIVDKVDEGQKKNRTEVTLRILRAPNFGPGQQEVFDTYYTDYVLARWSNWEDYAASLEGFRKEVRTDLLNAKSGPIHDHLNSLVLDYMKVRATGHYHPATRFNAMLMIGELNGVEARKSPVPLPAALPVLVSALGDPQQIDAVKVGALVGVLRHLELGAIKAPDDVKAVGDAALAVAGSKRPPGRSADGHAWMRKLAAEVLGGLGAVGDKGVVATTLAGMVAEAATPFYARCSAAEALGKLTYPADAGLDASKFSVPLGRLAVDACTAEAKAQAEAEAKAEPGPRTPFGPGGLPAPQPFPGPGGRRGPQPFPGPRGGPGVERVPGLGAPFGPQPGVEAPTQIPPVFRHRLRYRVNAAWVGLSGTVDNPGGVASLAKGTPHEKSVAALQQHLQAILDIIEANRKDDEDKLKEMMDKITPEADKVRALLSKPPP